MGQEAVRAAGVVVGREGGVAGVGLGRGGGLGVLGRQPSLEVCRNRSALPWVWVAGAAVFCRMPRRRSSYSRPLRSPRKAACTMGR